MRDNDFGDKLSAEHFGSRHPTDLTKPHTQLISYVCAASLQNLVRNAGYPDLTTGYSCRSAWIGSIVLARRAGRKPAPAVADTRISNAAAPVHMSVGAIPNSCDET